MCFAARDGFSGQLDYGFLGRVMELMGLDAGEQLEIITKVNRLETFLRQSKESKEGK